jgi:hypothetical protein
LWEKKEMVVLQLTPEELLALKKARNVGDVGKIAIAALKRIVAEYGEPATLVCGPLMTGTRRPILKNVRSVSLVASALKRKNVIVFEHLFFVRLIWRLAKANGVPLAEIDREIMRDFLYRPLLDARCGRRPCVGAIYFTGKWRRSEGAQWWHEEAQKRGLKIEVVVLRQDDHRAAVK